MFLAGVVDLFSRYPEEVATAALDVSLGLPGKYKWWPKIPEIKEMLDAIHAPILAAANWDKRAQEQLTERLALTDGTPRPRKTYEQIAAEFAEIGIVIGRQGSSNKPVDIAAIREKYGITQAQWDAIPTHEEDRANRDRQGLA